MIKGIEEIKISDEDLIEDCDPEMDEDKAVKKNKVRAKKIKDNKNYKAQYKAGGASIKVTLPEYVKHHYPKTENLIEIPDGMSDRTVETVKGMFLKEF